MPTLIWHLMSSAQGRLSLITLVLSGPFLRKKGHKHCDSRQWIWPRRGLLCGLWTEEQCSTRGAEPGLWGVISCWESWAMSSRHALFTPWVSHFNIFRPWMTVDNPRKRRREVQRETSMRQSLKLCKLYPTVLASTAWAAGQAFLNCVFTGET